jgi:outer membrane protein assembly factor BamB
MKFRSKFLKIFGVTAIIIVFSACTVTSRRDIWPEARTTHRIILEENSPLELLWSQEVFTGNGVFQKKLAATDGLVFFIGSLSQSDRGGLIALDGESGKMLWQVEDAHSLDATPAGVFVEYTSYVHAYNPHTGYELWSKRLPGARNVAYLYFIKDELYINTTGSYVYYRLDAQTGEVLERSLGNSIFADFDPWIFSHLPAINENTIYFWKVDAVSTPASSILAVSRDSDQVLWKSEDNVISNVAATATRVYFVTYDDELQILDGSTGDLIVALQIEPSINFFDREIDSQRDGYQLAVDPDEQLLYLILGDSNQMFAFRIHP